MPSFPLIIVSPHICMNTNTYIYVYICHAVYWVYSVLVITTYFKTDLLPVVFNLWIGLCEICYIHDDMSAGVSCVWYFHCILRIKICLESEGRVSHYLIIEVLRAIEREQKVVKLRQDHCPFGLRNRRGRKELWILLCISDPSGFYPNIWLLVFIISIN